MNTCELLKRTTAELGIGHKVRMLGARTISARSCRALDLLVVNSTAEPFGLVILEAMACGTPVLAAAVDGIPEIIEHGENGWLVPPGNEVNWRKRWYISAVNPELRERLGGTGKGRCRCALLGRSLPG